MCYKIHNSRSHTRNIQRQRRRKRQRRNINICIAIRRRWYLLNCFVFLNINANIIRGRMKWEREKKKNTNGASVITYHQKTRINWRNSWVSCFCYHFFVYHQLYPSSSLGEWVIVWNYSLVFFASIGACVAESLQFFAHNLIVLKKYFISVCTPNCLYVDIVQLDQFN